MDSRIYQQVYVVGIYQYLQQVYVERPPVQTIACDCTQGCNLFVHHLDSLEADLKSPYPMIYKIVGGGGGGGGWLGIVVFGSFWVENYVKPQSINERSYCITPSVTVIHWEWELFRLARRLRVK